MKENKRSALLHLRTAVCLVLVAMYIVGLVAMMTFSFSLGLVLWVVSSLGGVGLLYWVRTLEKRAEDAAKAEGAPSDPDDGTEPEPADDEACE